MFHQGKECLSCHGKFSPEDLVLWKKKHAKQMMSMMQNKFCIMDMRAQRHSQPQLESL